MYNKEYDNSGIHSKNYDIVGIIDKYYDDKNAIALDMGCGTCRKIIPLAGKIRHYYAIDHNYQMIEQAQINIAKNAISNISVHFGNNFYLPFDDHSIDIISGFLTTYSIEEIVRTLKPNGICILELLGSNDKKKVKQAFGQDHLGWRGCMLNSSQIDRPSRLKSIFEHHFSSIITQVYSYETITDRGQFESLLQMTPTIRDFSPVRDKGVIDSLSDGNGNISYTEEKIIMIAQK